MMKKSASQSAFFNLRVVLGFALCAVGALAALLVFSGFPGAASASAQGPAQNHKVSVSDRQLVASLQGQGGRMIADYGSSVLLDVNDKVANSLKGNRGAQIVDDYNMVLLNAGTIDTRTSAAKALHDATSSNIGKQMRLIQFAGPVRPEWYAALQATGIHIVTYIPHNAYLVYGDAQTLQAVRQLASNPAIAQWEGDYNAASRIDPAVSAQTTATAPRNLSARGNQQFIFQMVDDPPENAATLALIEQHKLEPVIQQDSMLGYVNVKVALPKEVVLNQIAHRGDVVSIQRYITPIPQDERQDIIMSGNLNGNVPVVMDYFDYLTSQGFSLNTIATFGVNLSDTGVDNGTQTPNHFGLYKSGDPTNPANSRIVYNRRIPSGGGTIQGCDGHGNINAHIIGGYVPSGTISGVNFDAFPHADASDFHWGRGLAPFVKIGSSVIFDPNYTFPIFKNIESPAYRDSARISSNSWGSPGDNQYDSQAQQYDFLVRDAQPDTGCTPPLCISAPGNQEYTIVFAAGNSGPGTHSVSSPSTAKNVICVGAAENVNLFGASDGCLIPDSGADSANDIISFSGRGPTSDNRIKPDIMGPGTHVSGGVAQQSIVSPTGSGTGDDFACFNGSLVCGGTGGSHFFPSGQQWYTASSGTSHSTPATAGVAALIRQHFIDLSLAVPSPALVKGLMLNSARYMTGVGANDTLPSNNQGMGEMDLNNLFDTFVVGHSFHDQVAADLFTATGQQRTVTGTVSSNTKPFRVTAAWTDAPGPTSGNAYVNNLDLEVTVGGNTYKGNVFTGAFSSTGGVADTRNNVESVFVPAGVSGAFTVKVTATNIAGDGVPGNGTPLDQDFALLVYNGSEGGGGTTLVSAASRLTHAAAGTFDVAMPLTGTSGVECRSSGTYNAVFTFNAAVTSGQVQVLSGTATVGATTFSGNSMTAQLTGVTSAEVVTLRARNINGDGQQHGDVPFGFLVGDVDASRLVGKPDQTLVKGQVNQTVTNANFRDDLDINGQIKTADANVVKTNQGHTIP